MHITANMESSSISAWPLGVWAVGALMGWLGVNWLSAIGAATMIVGCGAQCFQAWQAYKTRIKPRP